jgi:hypothetical protein
MVPPIATAHRSVVHRPRTFVFAPTGLSGTIVWVAPPHLMTVTFCSHVYIVRICTTTTVACIRPHLQTIIPATATVPLNLHLITLSVSVSRLKTTIIMISNGKRQLSRLMITTHATIKSSTAIVVITARKKVHVVS